MGKIPTFFRYFFLATSLSYLKLLNCSVRLCFQDMGLKGRPSFPSFMVLSYVPSLSFHPHHLKQITHTLLSLPHFPSKSHICTFSKGAQIWLPNLIFSTTKGLQVGVCSQFSKTPSSQECALFLLLWPGPLLLLLLLILLNLYISICLGWVDTNYSK